ncbi:DMT family transporter [Roseivirga sp. E12]|uniref:DMT family transporter n=1 Tax=Roseivirga sp. E12 TaxID=2819237 RepID=UPI001ABCC910|nr:DMT family transporter [Roseivirga sp. E12]MBO3699832.1 EamA family transporter [Roseivirga sp. E12]
MNSRYYTEGLIAVFLFGITPVFIKEVSANAFTIGIVRLVIGTAFLFTIIRTGKLKKLSKKDWKGLLYIGLLFGAHWITYFISVKLATPSIAILSVSSFGLHMIYLNWIINGQKPVLSDLIAVAVALFGIFLIVPEFNLENDLTAGILVGLVSAFFFAVLPFVQRRNQHIDSMTRAFGQYAFALLVFLTFTSESNWDLSQQDWIFLGILGVVCTVGAHTLWLRASTMLAPATTSLIFYLGTPIAMVTSYIFLNEEMNSSKLIGAALIVSANVFSAYKKRFKKSN